MSLSNKSTNAINVYNGSVSSTKVSVTTDTNIFIYGWSILNATAAEAYLQVFDASSTNVTVGTTTPTFVIGVGAEGNPSIALPIPILFTSGFTIASTTTRAGATGAIQEISIFYTSEA